MKIGLCGTMSVGKTTLVKALKKLPQFKDYKFATERSKYLNDLGIPLNTDSTLKGQTVFLAERCAELMKQNIVTDRTVFDVMETDEHYRDLIDFTITTLIKRYGHMANRIETIKGSTEDRVKQILSYL
jgi:deoxyadenosine/deoxycytidine kinase